MFARRSAAEIPPRCQNPGPLKLRLIERMTRILLPIVFKCMLAETIKGHTSQKPRRNNAVRIDVVEQKRNAGGGDRFDFVHLDNSLRNVVE